MGTSSQTKVWSVFSTAVYTDATIIKTAKRQGRAGGSAMRENAASLRMRCARV